MSESDATAKTAQPADPRTELGAKITERPDLAYQAKADAAAAPPETDPAPAEPARPAPPADPIHETLTAWANDRLANSPISRNTTAWNHLMAELPGLRDRIAKALGL